MAITCRRIPACPLGKYYEGNVRCGEPLWIFCCLITRRKRSHVLIFDKKRNKQKKKTKALRVKMLRFSQCSFSGLSVHSAPPTHEAVTLCPTFANLATQHSKKQNEPGKESRVSGVSGSVGKSCRQIAKRTRLTLCALQTLSGADWLVGNPICKWGVTRSPLCWIVAACT